MTIKQTNSDIQLGGFRNATVQLNVSEITTLCNAILLFEKQHPDNRDIKKLHIEIYTLMSMVKDGCLDSVAIDYLHKLQEELNQCDAS